MPDKQAFALLARPRKFVFDAPAEPRVSALVAFGFLVLSLVMQLPGNVPFDGITIWHEAETGQLYAQHPAALVLVWYLGELFVRGPAMFTALQLLSFWAAAAVLVARLRPPLWLAACFYIFLLVYPPLFAFSGVTVKDVFGAHLAVLAFVLALPAPGRPHRSAVWFAAFGLGVLATLFRYQFGLILPALAVLLGWENWRRSGDWRKPLIAAVAGAIATYAVVTLAVFTLFTHDGTGDVRLSLRKVMVYDIAGVVVEEPSASLALFARSGVNVAQLRAAMRQSYSPIRVDTLWQEGVEEPYSAQKGVFGRLWSVPHQTITQQWLDSVRSHPWAFIRHRTNTFAHVLGFGDDLYRCRPIRDGISTLPELAAYEVQAETYRPAFSAGLMRNAHFPVGLPFRSWFYSLICLVILVAGFAGARVPREAMLLSGLGLAYEASFFFLPQACEVRYSYPQMFAALFSLAMIAFAAARHRAEP